MTQIEVRTDDETVDVLTFPLGRVIIGRSPDNEVYIKSKFVSRHHAQLVSDEDGCVIEDLNSTNGVFLGEKQVKKYRLRDGDVFRSAYTNLSTMICATKAEASETVTEGDGEDAANDQESAVNNVALYSLHCRPSGV